MLYLDANVFIFAALNTESYGDKAELLLNRIQRGEEIGVTSALTVDEVFWEVKRNRSFEEALFTCEAMFRLKSLEIVPADRDIVFLALQIMRQFRLDSRDAIHAATALTEKVDAIVSTDRVFGKVKGLKWQNL